MLIFGPILGDILHPKILAKILWRHNLIGYDGCAVPFLRQGEVINIRASDSSVSPWRRRGTTVLSGAREVWGGVRLAQTKYKISAYNGLFEAFSALMLVFCSCVRITMLLSG